MVAVAGAAGAVLRYAIGAAFGTLAFPWTTLGINVAGSFLLGVVVQMGPSRLGDELRIAIAVGFLGAFTTFSTFSYETVTMVRAGRASTAAVYVGASIALGLAAAAAGYRLGAR